MSIQNITVGDHEYTLFSAPTSAFDPAIYRWENSAKAPMFRPTIKLSGKLNATRTNANMTVRVECPVVFTDADTGKQGSTDNVVGTFSFTSLQNTLRPETSEVIDAAIAALTAFKTNLVAGIVA